MRDSITTALKKSLSELGIDAEPVLDFPADLAHGDYSTNVALAAAKGVGKSPVKLAEEIVAKLGAVDGVSKIDVAGPGFINFHLSRDAFVEVIKSVDEKWGRNEHVKGYKVTVEYTDPNPFKEMHIGHVMSNTVGESVARLTMFCGADTWRVNYQGDVGMHVAKALWGLMKLEPTEIIPDILGKAYAKGATAYEEDEQAKGEITEINRKVYAHDPAVMDLYDKGRAVSLADFETIYARLGTKFDAYYFESVVADTGKKAVEEGLEKGVFEKSDGAVVFKGEEYGLHTRVFLNSLGIPTYEAKELGLAKVKYDERPYDLSIIVTANEIDQYFKVLLKAMEFIFPDLRKKTVHLSHGFLRLTSGKMSSRTGTVVTAKSLLDDLQTAIRERIDDPVIADQIGVAAIKYSILKQGIKGDIIFDEKQSLSFEGDSGPYLQYSYVRAMSVLAKAAGKGGDKVSETVPTFERLLPRFPDVVYRAAKEYEPHYVTTYLTELAGAFNSWYASEKILGTEDEAYKLMLVRAFAQTMKNGLWLLGITAPEKM